MILKQPSLWGTALGLFSSNYVFYFMLTWLPEYLRAERGFSVIDMATVATSAYMVNALERVSRRLGRRQISGARRLGECRLQIGDGGGARGLGDLHAGHGAWDRRRWRWSRLFVYQALCGASSPGVYAMSANPRRAALHRGDGWVSRTRSAICPGLSRHGSPAISSRARGISPMPSWWRRRVSMLGLIGWIWMVPRLAELDWKMAASGGRVAVL